MRLYHYLYGAFMLFSLGVTNAQSITNPNSKVTQAIDFIEHHLKGDHQSRFLQYNTKGDSILVETTDNEVSHLLDSLLPGIPKKVTILPEKFSDGKEYGIVALSVINQREAPAQAAEMMTQALMGTTVKFLKKMETGYSLVQTPDNYIAYAENSGIVPMTPQEKNEWEQAPKIIFTQLYGTVYSDNKETSLPVSDIVAGDRLKYLGEKGNYYKVQYPNGIIGYVLKKYAENYKSWLSKRQPTFENIYATGKRLLGVPYLWGGTSIKGVDCSGFIRTIFYLNGVLLPRDASQQARVGASLNIFENGLPNVAKALTVLHPGDLLFFGTKRKDGSDKVTHVAMYIGQGRFIQSAGFVKISSFDPASSDYDSGHVAQFLSAKRVLTHIGESGIELLQ